MRNQTEQQQELHRLLLSGDEARRSLARLEEQRHRLLRDIDRIEESVRRLQDVLSPEARAQVQDDLLAAQLNRLDEEMSAPVTHLTGLAAAPGGVERRTTPRPETIRLPALASITTALAETETPPPFLERARRALRGNREQQPQGL